MDETQAGPLTTDYADGRRDGTYAFERFGPEAADEMLYLVQTLNQKSLYTLAFARSVSEAIANSLG